MSLANLPHHALPLSRRLREATREVHERVETGASFNRLVVVHLPADAAAPDPATRERLARARGEYREVYRRFLVAAHGFEAAAGAALAAAPAAVRAAAAGLPDEGADPAALARADLAEVFGPGRAEGLPAMPALAPPDSPAALAGLAYVRLGSRAGGAVIGAAVRRNLGLTRERGATFLLRHGSRTRALLDGMRAWLDTRDLVGDEAGAAVAAAVATFESVGRWHAALEARFARGLA